MSNQEEYNKLINLDNNFDFNFNNSQQGQDSGHKTTITIDDSIEKNENININLDDYNIPDDESDYLTHVDILNIYNVYHKTLYNKNNNATLFDEIDIENITSTNRSLENLFDEIHRYKTSDKRFTTLYDPIVYKNTYLQHAKLPEGHPFYIIKIDDVEKVTHNLITGINFIASNDWKNIKWSINQINDF